MHHKFENMNPATEFGKWLYSNMIANDMSCTDLAHRLHVTKQTVVYHINGISYPNYPFVLAYCLVLGDDHNIDSIWEMVLRDKNGIETRAQNNVYYEKETKQGKL